METRIYKYNNLNEAFVEANRYFNIISNTYSCSNVLLVEHINQQGVKMYKVTFDLNEYFTEPTQKHHVHLFSI